MQWLCGGSVLALACRAFGYPNNTFQALPGGRGVYLWQEGQAPRFLSELLDFQSLGWTDIVIHASNRVGQFVGYGKVNGQLRTLIASPVP